jgi:hypothetical protein
MYPPSPNILTAAPFMGALRPVERREIVTHLVTVSGLPVQRACRAVGLGRAMYYRPLRCRKWGYGSFN